MQKCVNRLLNTFRIDLALSKKRSQEPLNDGRGITSGGGNVDESKLAEIKASIDSIPKYSSHYCRNETSSNFLSPNLNLQILYDLYKEKHPRL